MKKKYIGIYGFAFVLLVSFILLSLSGNNKHSKKIIIHKKDVNKETEVFVEIEKEVKKKPVIKPAIKPAAKKESPAKADSRKGISDKGNNNDISGELPPISANYRKYVGFRKYSREMIKAGCRFFILGEGCSNIYEIDFLNEELIEGSLSDLNPDKFCSRSRVIVDEPAVNVYLSKAETKYKVEHPEVIMLVPKSMEKNILNILLKQVSDMSSLISMNGYYRLDNQGLKLVINQLNFAEKIIKTNIEIRI